jgi:hypothetical protein
VSVVLGRKNTQGMSGQVCRTDSGSSTGDISRDAVRRVRQGRSGACGSPLLSWTVCMCMQWLIDVFLLGAV